MGGDHRKVGGVNVPKAEISLALREGTCCELSADGRGENIRALLKRNMWA